MRQRARLCLTRAWQVTCWLCLVLLLRGPFVFWVRVAQGLRRVQMHKLCLALPALWLMAGLFVAAGWWSDALTQEGTRLAQLELDWLAQALPH